MEGLDESGEILGLSRCEKSGRLTARIQSIVNVVGFSIGFGSVFFVDCFVGDVHGAVVVENGWAVTPPMVAAGPPK